MHFSRIIEKSVGVAGVRSLNRHVCDNNRRVDSNWSLILSADAKSGTELVIS